MCKVGVRAALTWDIAAVRHGGERRGGEEKSVE